MYVSVYVYNNYRIGAILVKITQIPPLSSFSNLSDLIFKCQINKYHTQVQHAKGEYDY